MEDSKRQTVRKIKQLQGEIEKALEETLNEEGTIDILKLKESSESLSAIFDVILESKTWKDDPKDFAKEVARMLEAREKGNELSNALEKLEEALNSQPPATAVSTG